MAYKRIESYGVIGDMYSVALVGLDGSIDWCCLPHFDSPSIFAGILDDKIGGNFKIAAQSRHARRQMYLPETNVLVTRFLSPNGVGEVIDFMPVYETQERRPRVHQIVRMVKVVRGSVAFRLECLPACDYARQTHERTLEARGALFQTADCRLELATDQPLVEHKSGVGLDFTLNAGQSSTFVLRYIAMDSPLEPFEALTDGEALLRETIQFWKAWIGRCRYTGRWREMVQRSALVLKLLTFQPTGAVVAAPTTSLPEGIPGVRNWDYRYTWVRDAAFTIYAFLRLGYADEATAFFDFLQHRAAEPEGLGPLNVMYRIDGRHELPEFILDHLDGYRGCRPVRVGNAASHQLQLDIYGELIDSVYLYNKYANEISYSLWLDIRRMLEWVADNWERPDLSIWESRGIPQQFVYSKVQCWVALDRGLRIAMKRGLPIDYERMRKASGRIYEWIMEKGWNADRNAFVQAEGGDALDAANILMSLVRFVSPTDPKILSTLDRTLEELVSDNLVHRYRIGRAADDGLPGSEGTFSVCTFWLVEALSRSGRLDEARLIFEKMLTYANHLGLYAEEIGPSGEALGNFPQAFTHLGLISAALELDRKLEGPGAGVIQYPH